jgi:cytidylate kinase
VSNDIYPVPAVPRRGLVVALDGPSSSGKTTVGVEAARRLGYRFCDTGLLYRAVTWLAVDRGVPSTDVSTVVALVPEIVLVADDRGRLRHVKAAGRDVTTLVRGPEVDRSVSEYSKVPDVRTALLGRQREIAADRGIIMAGRDIGTVVLPDADIKIYLDASAEERARRRAAQRRIHAPGEMDAILADLRRRDSIDSTRVTAPLRQAADATVIRTDGNTFHQTVAAVVRLVRDRQRALDAGAAQAATLRGEQR